MHAHPTVEDLMTHAPTFPEPGEALASARPSKETLELLARRRSTVAKTMTGPGPSGEQLDTLLKIAARTPDHGKLFPWRFVVFEGEDSFIARYDAKTGEQIWKTERDTATIDSLQAPVRSFVAGSELDELESRLNRVGAENSELEAEVARLREQVQEPSIWRMARATANDFGITIGWVGLYFTLFLAWWSGRTPGKYLLGIRVVQLNGDPITLWGAFERFGGYAAGIATGLLGFVQLYWDPNRQAIHDRVARTVVIQTREA